MKLNFRHSIVTNIFSLSRAGPVIFGPFDSTTPYSIPWPNTQEPFQTSLGPFGPYGPYPLSEATPARSTESSTTAMSAASQTSSESLPPVEQSPPVENRSIVESLSEAVPIDIEEEDNEDEDYEDVADEQDEEDNEEENDGNDDEDEGKLKIELESRLSCYDLTHNVIADAAVSNLPTTEATTNATSDSAFDAIPEIPDGVDPSFLAALPQEMREEVLAEHNR